MRPQSGISGNSKVSKAITNTLGMLNTIRINSGKPNVKSRKDNLKSERVANRIIGVPNAYRGQGISRAHTNNSNEGERKLIRQGISQEVPPSMVGASSRGTQRLLSKQKLI
jgi:hypothetical protein